MWLSSKKAAEILGVNLRKLQRVISKAQKQNQKILIINTQKTMYRYITGVGGNSGKTLQIWLDDEKRTDKDPISGKKADNLQICNGQIISQGYKADEIPQEVSANLQGNETDTRTTTQGNDETDTRSAMQGNETDTHLTTHADEICARATMQGNDETDTRTTTQGNDETDTRVTMRVTTQADEMNKCAKIHINETKSNHKTIKDLENMQKLKAIHDFNNRPCGMGKTLWGKNVAEKYKVSLKTLYAWKKELAGDEKVEKAICFDESGNIIYQNDELCARKDGPSAIKDDFSARNDELYARNGEFHELHTQNGEFHARNEMHTQNDGLSEFGARKDGPSARKDDFRTQNDGLSEPGARKDEMRARNGADKNIDINESAENSGLIDVNEYKKVNFKAVFKSSSFELKALEWALGAWLNNPLSTKKFIFEKLKDEALKNGWNIGSYKSFARLFNKPEIKALLIRATAGERGVRNEIPPFILRDLNRYESMELICGDQIVFDFDVTNENGEVINPNAYVWVDMGSSAIIGIDIVLGKYNKISVAESLRMALNFGVPKAVYTDNGKPELSGHVKDILSQIKGVKLKDFDDFDERVVHKRAKPGNSRAKPIENIFNHVQRWLMQEVIFDNGGAGYHKRNNKNSDEVMKKYMKSHPLDYENFINYFAKAVKKWNNHTISSRGIVPIESFIQKLDKNPVYRLDETTMEFIFSPRRVIKVRNSSVKLQINKKIYMYSHPILSKFNGKKVEVRLNGGDINSVIVLDIEKFEFLCEAGLNEKIDPRDYRALMQKLNRNEAVVKAVNKAFYYYKKLYRPDYKLNAYVGLARNVKVKSENYKKLKKKFAMSNEKLLEAM